MWREEVTTKIYGRESKCVSRKLLMDTSGRCPVRDAAGDLRRVTCFGSVVMLEWPLPVGDSQSIPGHSPLLTVLLLSPLILP